MNCELVQNGNNGVGETLRIYGKKAIYYIGKIANHPLTKWAAGGYIGYRLGDLVMKNDYTASVDLGFARFSLCKNPTTKQ